MYSLDRAGPRSELILSFSSHRVIDLEGPDLVVFENPFEIAEGQHFMDLVVVGVSENGVDFVDFPHTFAGDTYSANPENWAGFAGVQPVLHDAEDPESPAVDDPESGGDRFDLADVGLLAITHVRLRPASSFPSDPISNGPDIDAVYAIHVEESR